MNPLIYAGLSLHDQRNYRRSLPVDRFEEMQGIVRHIFAYYAVDYDLAFTADRHEYIVKPRQIAMYFIRERLKLGFKVIGDFLGNRDHSTVMYSISIVAGRIDFDRKYRQQIADLDKLF